MLFYHIHIPLQREGNFVIRVTIQGSGAMLLRVERLCIEESSDICHGFSICELLDKRDKSFILVVASCRQTRVVCSTVCRHKGVFMAASITP